MKDELKAVETCCFNCKLKSICQIINNIWSPEFKRNIAKAAEADKVQRFFEAVERFLANICDFYNPEL